MTVNVPFAESYTSALGRPLVVLPAAIKTIPLSSSVAVWSYRPVFMLPVEIYPAVPVPLSVAVCGLLLALSTTVIEPVAVPVLVGLDVKLTVHKVFGLSVPKQLFI